MGDDALGLLRRYESLLPGESLGSSAVDRGQRGVTASRLPDGRCLVAYAEEVVFAEGKTATIGTDVALPDAAETGLTPRYVREFRGAFDAGREFERLSKLLVQEPPPGAKESADEEERGWYEEQDALRVRGREEIEERILSLRRRILFDEIVRADERAVSTAPGTEEGSFWRSLSASLWAEAEKTVPDADDLYLYQTLARMRRAAEDPEAEGRA